MMEMNITSDSNNKALDRREIEFSVVQDAATVDKGEIKKELCKRLNLNPDSTIINSLKQEFGVRRCSGMANSYRSKEEMERLEPAYIIKRLSKKKGATQQPTDQADSAAAPKAKAEEKQESKKADAAEGKEEAK
jgi:ribosomal protein S24E